MEETEFRNENPFGFVGWADGLVVAGVFLDTADTAEDAGSPVDPFTGLALPSSPPLLGITGWAEIAAGSDNFSLAGFPR
jgi:hypothetical protein